MYKIKHKISLIALCCLAMVGSGCHKRVGPTQLRIVDPERHYYPLVQGEELKMNFLIVNEGKVPFIIKDVQPASLSIELTQAPPKLVPAGDSAHISLVYHTDLNIGYVSHKIRIFGNVIQVNDSAVSGEAVLTFDSHIVRPTLDKSDYEERYWERKAANEKLVEGTRGEQGYYTDEDLRENELNDNYEFYPNNKRDKQVEKTVEMMTLKKRN